MHACFFLNHQGVGTVEDINEQAEWLNSIKINQLNNRALTLASKLAREIRTQSGNIIKLQDKEIAMRLAEQVAQIDKPELHMLYREFLEEAISNPVSTVSTSETPKGTYRGIKTN